MQETIIVELDPETIARIDALAKQLGLTRDELLRRLVASRLDAVTKKNGEP